MKYIWLMLFYMVLSYCTSSYLVDVFSPSLVFASGYILQHVCGIFSISIIMFILMRNTK